MDLLVTSALVGTAKQPLPQAPDNEPADRLVGRLAGTEAEVRLLLTAGARSVYELAGYEAPALEPPPAPAAAEVLPSCCEPVARLVGEMLAGQFVELLPEALGRLRQARLILPPELLPAALNVSNSELRAALAAVLGKRAIWLSQFNADWGWLTVSVATASPQDLKRQWDEAELSVRISALSHMRTLNAAEARTWVEASWKGEKAEHRKLALESLATGLSAGDESLLEAALDDRSKEVRQSAARLLARLPHSAWLTRMQARADGWITYGGGLLKRRKLHCTPPEELDKPAARDGISEKPPSGVGPRAWWTSQLAGLLRPQYWAARFSVVPAELIVAAANDDYGANIIEGWTEAVLDHGGADWLAPLWDYWEAARTRKKAETEAQTRAEEFLVRLLGRMSSEAAEGLVVERLRAPAAGDDALLMRLLSALATPWSAALARQFLEAVRKVSENGERGRFWAWTSALQRAAMAIGVEAFALAVAPWDLPEQEKYMQREVQRFQDTIGKRKLLFEEIGS